MTSSGQLLMDQETPRSNPYAWVVVTVTLLAGLAAPMNQFKVPPVMPVLMEQYNLDLTTAGLLMSIFAITGLVLALPAGIILHRWGLRATGLLAVGVMAGGAVLGAIAGDIFSLLLSRLVEGVGMGLIAVVGPAVITLWFPPRKRGLPMGIWATWVPLGSLIIYNLAPLVNNLAGWKMVWWMTAGFTLLIFILFWLFFRLPGEENKGVGEGKEEEKDSQLVSFREALSSREIWLLALSFGCYNFVVIGVIATYYPTFLKTVQNFSLVEASYVTSIKMAVCIILAPLIGWFLDKIGSPKKTIMAAFFSLVFVMLFTFNLTGWQVSALMVVLGLIAAAIAPATFSSVPVVTRPGRPIGITIAVLMIGQNLGQLLGPLVFGGLAVSIGWAPAGYWMITVLVIGMAGTWLIRMK
ncbi:MAG: nitrate/nitrite transporter [Anaerolineaceae bacterium]